MYKNMDTIDLIQLEDSLDYRDPDIIEEILDRADWYEEGIKQAYIDACNADDPQTFDLIFQKAVSILKGAI